LVFKPHADDDEGGADPNQAVRNTTLWIFNIFCSTLQPDEGSSERTFHFVEIHFVTLNFLSSVPPFRFFPKRGHGLIGVCIAVQEKVIQREPEDFGIRES